MIASRVKKQKATKRTTHATKITINKSLFCTQKEGLAETDSPLITTTGVRVPSELAIEFVEISLFVDSLLCSSSDIVDLEDVARLFFLPHNLLFR
jgi:hypothetical protein